MVSPHLKYLGTQKYSMLPIDQQWDAEIRYRFSIGCFRNFSQQVKLRLIFIRWSEWIGMQRMISSIQTVNKILLSRCHKVFVAKQIWSDTDLNHWQTSVLLAGKLTINSDEQFIYLFLITLPLLFNSLWMWQSNDRLIDRKTASYR